MYKYTTDGVPYRSTADRNELLIRSGLGDMSQSPSIQRRAAEFRQQNRMQYISDRTGITCPDTLLKLDDLMEPAKVSRLAVLASEQRMNRPGRKPSSKFVAEYDKHLARFNTLQAEIFEIYKAHNINP